MQSSHVYTHTEETRGITPTLLGSPRADAVAANTTTEAPAMAGPIDSPRLTSRLWLETCFDVQLLRFWSCQLTEAGSRHAPTRALHVDLETELKKAAVKQPMRVY